MEKQSLIKRASLAIKTLYKEKNSLESEVTELRDELEKLSMAKELTLKLMKLGAFPIEDFEDQFNDFSEKTAEELHTFEKAAELVKTGNFDLGLGSLSEEPQSSGSAEDRFIFSLVE